MSYNQFLVATQTEKPFDQPNMVKNNACGFVFNISPEDRVRRFCMLGADAGTYYVAPREFARENIDYLITLAKSDDCALPLTVVEMATAVPSRVPKMEHCLLALAVCTALGAPKIKSYALERLTAVCRIPTHLFTFIQYHKMLGGKLGGRAMKRALQNWYLSKGNMNLAYHLTKYGNRNGWSSRDVLRLARPKPNDLTQEALFRFAVTGELFTPTDSANGYEFPTGTPEGYIQAVQKLKSTRDVNEAIDLVRVNGLTHEMVPNGLKNSPELWDALLRSMPATALLRNLGKISSLGLLSPLSDTESFVVRNLEMFGKSPGTRIHPMNFLVASLVYQGGKGVRGSLSWVPSQRVVGALETAFYDSMNTYPALGKRTMFACDISGSMGDRVFRPGYGGPQIMGIPGFSPALASGALALSYLRMEPECILSAFHTNMRIVPATKNTDLRGLQAAWGTWGMGATDCAAPMLWAAANKVPVDVFHVATDNETYAGNVHPYKALESYRQKMGINAGLVVHGMTSTGFTIANPTDPLMLDVVGFDTSVPEVVRSMFGE